jgi:hypothetical protein
LLPGVNLGTIPVSSTVLKGLLRLARNSIRVPFIRMGKAATVEIFDRFHHVLALADD